MDKKRILFVDDDPLILSGIQALMRKERHRWDVTFASGGPTALGETRKQPFDVVVTDMRMPGLDGAGLLRFLQMESPGTVRILLSAYSDRNAIVRALPAVHQVLAKPCDIHVLRRAIEQGLHGDAHQPDAAVRSLLGTLDRLPGAAAVLMEVLRAPSSTIEDVTALVESDPALAAKILQLVGMAYFGTGQPTTSIGEAIAQLGITRLRYVGLTTPVFSAFSDAFRPAPIVASLRNTAALVARIARRLLPGPSQDAAFAAGLLHNIGKLALVSRREPVAELSAEAGARLLSIWGIAGELVECVGFQGDPGSAPERSRMIASAVHVAAAVACAPDDPPLALDSLERAGAAHLVRDWVDEARRARTGR